MLKQSLIAGLVIVAIILIFAGDKWYSRNLELVMEWYGFPGDSLAAQRRGQFGDQFGGFTALISALTMSGAVAAVLLQTVELRRQRTAAQAATARYREDRDATRNWQRISTALELYREWNTEDLLSARRILGSELLQHGGAITASISGYEESGAPIAIHVLRLHAYFEQWAVLSEREDIDKEMMKSLLGGSYEHWKKIVLIPCWNLEKSSAVLKMKTRIEQQLG